MTYKYCISDRLVCDGVHNCDFGDQSDENMCHLYYIKENPIASAIGSAVALTITFALLRVFYCCFCTRPRLESYRSKSIKNKELSGASISDEADVNKLNAIYDENGRLRKTKNSSCCSRMCMSHSGSHQIEEICGGPELHDQNKRPSIVISKNGFEAVELYTNTYINSLHPNDRNPSVHSLNSNDVNIIQGNLKRNSSFQRAMYVKVDV
jgi:hypothetical protein